MPLSSNQYIPKTATRARATRKLKICAIASMGLLLLFIIIELLRAYQTQQMLAGPLVPDAAVQQLSQPYLTHAVVSTIMLLIAVGIYLLKRYWWAILLVAITLVGNQLLTW